MGRGFTTRLILANAVLYPSLIVTVYEVFTGGETTGFDIDDDHGGEPTGLDVHENV
jgi:hypothetical protein